MDLALRDLDLKSAKGWTTARQSEKSHGRQTTRSIIASTALDTIDAEMRSRWQGLASVIAVEN